MCEASGQSEKPTRLWRNGMDFEPKKTYPPDYSNVPNVRDWQMSPFGNERFDLDEIQRAEKKGYKGRHELEAVKKRLAALNVKDEKPSSPPPCPKCKEREEAERRLLNVPRPNVRCTSEYLYQPYGPQVVSTLSYTRPSFNPPKLYTSLGPSPYSGFRMKVPAPSFYSTIPCSSLDVIDRDFAGSYSPLGPFGEVRLTGDMYTPMGPSTFPIKF